MLRSQRSVSVTALELPISSMTARRDAILARSGLARRTHGRRCCPTSRPADSFRHRLELEADEKRLMAQAVVDTLEPGDPVHRLVDDRLVRRPEITTRAIALTVLTNSLPVINLVSQAEVRTSISSRSADRFAPLTHSFVGPDVVRALHGYAPTGSCSRSRASRPTAT
jgi:DeoR/GlpR family transcriptional regulator of sugar metabolism